jgi:HPt (histidine-containing phosphotransfer) domain-containing protein
MTAHVLDEYQDQCAKAGMNDFLPKPVEYAALAEAIAEVTVELTDIENCAIGKNPLKGKPLPTLDREGTLRLLGGDQDLLNEVIDIFLQETAPVFEKLKISVACGDCKSAFVKAHTLKGGCLRIGALFCADLAGELEYLAKKGDLTALKSQFVPFESEFDRMIALLKWGDTNGVYTE